MFFHKKVPESESVDGLFETTAEVGVVVLEGDGVDGELTKIFTPLGLLRPSKSWATGGKIRGDLVFGSFFIEKYLNRRV